MGLGKSLSMISLVLARPLRLSKDENSHGVSKGTLLVVPLNGKKTRRLRQTQTEDVINSVGNLGSSARQVIRYPFSGGADAYSSIRHLHKDAISYYRYHGSQRKPDSLAEHDVVITTYHTIASEWKRERRDAKTVFSLHWHRVVIDEGISHRK